MEKNELFIPYQNFGRFEEKENESIHFQEIIGHIIFKDNLEWEKERKKNVIENDLIKDHLLKFALHPLDDEVHLEAAPITQVENPEFVELPATPEGVLEFLSHEPQYDIQGRLRYLLSCGIAVELITGKQREHHDIDLILFDYRKRWWVKYLTDNRIPQNMWANMNIDPEYLEQTAWDATVLSDGIEHTVGTVHPAIIMIQKLSNSWGRRPRRIDVIDAVNIYYYWANELDYDPEWKEIFREAILALPEQERSETLTLLTVIEGTDKEMRWREKVEEVEIETHQPIEQREGRFRHILRLLATR